MSFDFSESSTNGSSTTKIYTWTGTLADLLNSEVPPRFKNNADTQLSVKATDGFYIVRVNSDATGFDLVAPTDGSGTTPSISYLSYDDSTGMQLTTTPSVVSGFVETITAVGWDYSGGTFTVNDPAGGLYFITLERIYRNDDNNPSDPPVVVNIQLLVNGNVEYARSAPITSATANDEPALISFTSNFIRQLADGDELQIVTWADDGGGNPDDTYLNLMRVVGHKIFAV